MLMPLERPWEKLPSPLIKLIFVDVPDISLADAVRWARNPDTSMAQLRQVYDWKTSQWATAANAILTSFLGFVSAVVLSYFKADFLWAYHPRRVAAIVLWGTMTAGLVYWLCQDSLSVLRAEFLALYRLLDTLRSH